MDFWDGLTIVCMGLWVSLCMVCIYEGGIICVLYMKMVRDLYKGRRGRSSERLVAITFIEMSLDAHTLVDVMWACNFN